jgi:beta-glucosidase
MGPRRRTTALAATVVAISLMVAGGVMAATQSRDEAALQPVRQGADRGIEGRVERLLAQMTLEEKLQQVQLLSDGQITDEDARKGVGGVFSLVDPVKIRHL